MINSQPVLFSIILYLFLAGIVWILQPAIMFTSTGEMKEYGTSDSLHDTVFSYWMFLIVLSIVSYFISVIIRNE